MNTNVEIDSKYYQWRFTSLDGEVLYPWYTKQEIVELKIKYPGDFWK